MNGLHQRIWPPPGLNISKTFNAASNTVSGQVNPYAPKYNPDEWNESAEALSRNNCYEYAVCGIGNRGLRNGDKSVANIGESKLIVDYQKLALMPMPDDLAIALTELDGAEFAGHDHQADRSGFYQVALYIRNSDNNAETADGYADFHFVRENSDGSWSHKFGHKSVELFAGGDKLEELPETFKGDAGEYRRIGYFFIPAEGLNPGIDVLVQKIYNGTYEAPKDNPVIDRYKDMFVNIGEPNVTISSFMNGVKDYFMREGAEEMYNQFVDICSQSAGLDLESYKTSPVEQSAPAILKP